MYKNIEELRKMSLQEIAQYVVEIEKLDNGVNSVDFQDFCCNELDDVLTEKYGTDEYLYIWNDLLNDMKED